MRAGTWWNATCPRGGERWTLTFLLILIALAFGTPAIGLSPARAETCPVPEPFAIEAGALPATTAAIAAHKLTVMALGGASTLGAAAKGSEFTYPARLAARLEKAFPKTEVKVVVVSVPREALSTLQSRLETELARSKPALVIWGTGAGAAARGEDLETFITAVTDTVEKIRATGTDVILMTLQYAPSVVRLINLAPYRMAVIRTGDMAGVPVLDRYELMRYWNGSFMDLDATGAAERVKVARTLYDCIAETITQGLVDAIR